MKIRKYLVIKISFKTFDAKKTKENTTQFMLPCGWIINSQYTSKYFDIFYVRTVFIIY